MIFERLYQKTMQTMIPLTLARTGNSMKSMCNPCYPPISLNLT